MKKALLLLVVLGVLFAGAFGIHAGLVAASRGTGALSEQAQGACSYCHGG